MYIHSPGLKILSKKKGKWKDMQLCILSVLRSFERPRVLSTWRLQPECSVGDLKRRRLKLKHAWQLNRGLYSYGPSTAGCSQDANYERRLKSLQVKSVHKRQRLSSWLSMKLSPCMCSYSSCPGWRNDWHIHHTFISAPGTFMHYGCAYALI